MAFVNLLQAIYPVGSCYFSTVATSPATVVGGTWAAMTGGMLGLAGSTGVAGAASTGGSLTISKNQLPSHSHGLYNPSQPFSGTAQRLTTAAGDGSSRWAFIADTQADLTWMRETDETGGGAEFYTCSYLCLRLEENRLRELVIANGIH